VFVYFLHFSPNAFPKIGKKQLGQLVIVEVYFPAKVNT